MERATRNTRKFTFKNPNMLNLRKLGSMVTSRESFQDRHGGLLSILKIKVEEGILNTLVQFYDPLYHCFTFLDYQLVPTLEEYSTWLVYKYMIKYLSTVLNQFLKTQPLQ